MCLSLKPTDVPTAEIATPLGDTATRTLPIPLDEESWRMLDVLAQRFYGDRMGKSSTLGKQRGRWRGRIVEMAIQGLYRRTFSDKGTG